MQVGNASLGGDAQFLIWAYSSRWFLQQELEQRTQYNLRFFIQHLIFRDKLSLFVVSRHKLLHYFIISVFVGRPCIT